MTPFRDSSLFAGSSPPANNGNATMSAPPAAMTREGPGYANHPSVSPWHGAAGVSGIERRMRDFST